MLFRLSIRNIFRNPGRSLITVSSVVAGLSASLLLASFARGMSEQFVQDAIWNLTGHATISSPEYVNDPVIDHRFSLSSEQRASLDALSMRWTSRVRVPGVVLSERDSAGVTFVGVSPGDEVGMSFIGDAQVEGRFLENESDKGVVLGRALVSQLQTGLGKRVVVMSQDSENELANKGFRVVGIFDAELESIEKGYAFFGKARLQSILGVGDEVSEVSLLLEDRTEVDAAASKLHDAFLDLKVSTWPELQPLVRAMVEVQDYFLGLFFFIVVVAVSFGLVNTLFMAIFERTREIGLLQSLGMKPRFIVYQILIESFLLLVFGALLGNAIAFFGVAMLPDGINLASFSRATEHFGLRSVVYPIILFRDCFLLNVMILVLGLLASFYPAFRASRLHPVEAMRKH